MKVQRVKHDVHTPAFIPVSDVLPRQGPILPQVALLSYILYPTLAFLCFVRTDTSMHILFRFAPILER
jgi:hypothetical protein